MRPLELPVDDTMNIFLIGVGGQGLVMLNRVLATAALLSGLDAKSTDTAGLAMRGGSVLGTLRIGPQVETSLFLPGRGHLLVALEPLEALHGLSMMGKNAAAVVNTDQLWPTEVCLETKKYPGTWREIMEKAGLRVHRLNGKRLAAKVGDPRMTNLIMAGALSHLLPIETEQFLKAIRKVTPKETLDKNLRAFELGREEKL